MYDIDGQANYEMLKYCPRCAGDLVESKVRGHRRLTCSECSYIFYMPPASVTCVIAERGGELLLVLRKYSPGKGKWCLPAGFIEAGEQPAASASREVKEETGLDVEITGLFDSWATDEDPRTPVVSIAFTARVVGGTLAPGDDAAEARFFAPDSLPDNIAFVDHTRVIREYLNGRRPDRASTDE